MSRIAAFNASAETLDTLRFPLWGSRLIEASAGTGKTYTIASLYVRLVLGHGDLPQGRALMPPEILVVTFTRAATQELRDRIRRRLTEAASCFLQESEGDPFLQQLRSEYEPERWPACARLLHVAAEWMDDAAVSTIDAWCYRMLREHAFDTASLFDLEMDVDEATGVAEATRDYWRLFIAPLDAESMRLVLQAIRAAMPRSDATDAADCDALAGVLRGWLPHAHQYAECPDPQSIFNDLCAQRDALKAAWLEWVPQLTELFQEAYDAKQFDIGAMRINHWKEWLRKLDEWARDPDARLPFDKKLKAWERLTPGGISEIWKVGDPPVHPAFNAIATMRDDMAALEIQAARLLPHAACWVAERLAELRRQRAMLSFSGLLDQLDAALGGPNGAKLARTLRAQFPAALIDEFQDTNPVQYRVFERIYDIQANSPETLLALIGDPKQAIYRFRGADIHAYLAARQHCEGRLYTLGNNYRSSAAMVAAVNHMFHTAEMERNKGAFLFRRLNAEGDVVADPIPFQPVKAAKDPGTWWVDDEPATALTVWCDTTLGAAREAGAEAVAQSCASEVLRLLQLAGEGRAGFRKDGTFTPLHSGDIAILVNTWREAALLRAALAGRGIRSVYLSDESSVYRNVAAADMLAWLRACAEPERGGYVRAALATAGIGLSWQQLDAFVRDELRWEAMLERFAGYKEQWRRRGVLPMLRQLMHDFGVPARLFADQSGQTLEGERQLTDFLHLAELLQTAASRLDGEHALIRYLEEHIERGGDPDADGDPSRMRLESDAGLVQVVTVHKSKGLEYPLVFYPYAYYSRASDTLELPAVYRDAHGQLCALANLADADAAEQGKILASIEHERLAEDLRKLYVALTRARHATWVALAPVDLLAASAFGYLLGGPAACEAETLEASVNQLARGCADIAVQAFPSSLSGWYQAPDAATAPLTWRSMSRAITQRWSVSSYSALARLALDAPGLDSSAELTSASNALPDDARLDVFLESYAAEVVGADDDEGEIEIADIVTPRSRASGSNAIAPAADSLHAFPRGAAPGSFLHGLLEWVFRQGPQQVVADPKALIELVEKRCRSRGWEQHAESLVSWLLGFITQRFRMALPRSGAQSDLVLCELTTAVPEMEFWFGVRDTDLPALDALVSRHCLPGLARPQIVRGQLNGMLRGFVDLVFEHEGRYYVADYKSNGLGADDEAYHSDAIARAVLDHRYDLQAFIYLFALHRLLQARLGERYEYERHVGGALVFFVRGNRAKGQGVHIERPPAEVMRAFELIFQGKEEGAHV